MDLLTAVFIFVLIWWIVIFTILPFGNAAAERPELGHASGAPANPRIKQKLVITTVISLVLTGFLALVLHYTGFSLHKWVKAWVDSSYR